MDTGAASHVIPKTLLPNVKLEHNGEPQKIVAANGYRIQRPGYQTIPSKKNKEFRRSIKFIKCERSQALYFHEEGSAGRQRRSVGRGQP